MILIINWFFKIVNLKVCTITTFILSRWTVLHFTLSTGSTESLCAVLILIDAGHMRAPA